MHSARDARRRHFIWRVKCVSLTDTQLCGCSGGRESLCLAPAAAHDRRGPSHFSPKMQKARKRRSDERRGEGNGARARSNAEGDVFASVELQ